MKPLCPLAARICEVYDFPPIMFTPAPKAPPTPREREQARRAELFRRNQAALEKMRLEQVSGDIAAKVENITLPAGNLGKVITLAAHRFDVPAKAIMSRARKEQYQGPRRAVVMIARDYLGMTYPQIGRMMRRDHTSIIHAERRGMDMLCQDLHFAKTYALLCGDVRKVVGNVTGESAAYQRLRNDDIKARAKREPIADIAEHYGLSVGKVERIVRLGE